MTAYNDTQRLDFLLTHISLVLDNNEIFNPTREDIDKVMRDQKENWEPISKEDQKVFVESLIRKSE